MIVDSLIALFLGIASYIVGLFPSAGSPTTALGPLQTALTTIAPYLSSTGDWLPWSAAFAAFALAAVCLGVGVGVKFVRIVASFATVGGGSAG